MKDDSERGEDVRKRHCRSTNLLNSLPVTGLETPLLALRHFLTKGAGIETSPVASTRVR